MKNLGTTQTDYERLFNLCMEHTDNLFLMLSCNFVINYINPVAEQILGWDKNAILNKNISDIFLEKSMSPFIDKRHPERTNNTVTEVIYNNKPLRISWIITREKNNGVIFITGKRESINSNDELEQLQLENVLKFAPGFFYWKDKHSVYQGCNDEFARLAGLESRTQVKGKTDYDLIWKDRAELYVNIDKEIINSGIAKLNHVEVIEISNNKTITAITNKVPLLNSDGQIIGLLGTTTDITYQKKTELALEVAKELAESANKAKTEFLSNMRHDIRTPLSGIVGFAELLKSESTETHIKEYADNLVASSHALLHLLDDVLEAVRVSSGDIPMLKRKFNLSHLFEQVIALCKARASEKRLKLNLEMDKNLPCYAIGDKIRLHRIALELVGNALNFTNNGHVTLNIKLAKQENRNLVIKMTVTDSGIGIPKDKQQDIYVQFKRLTPSYQGIYKGAGLGLYVVKQFIDELNGEIYVESEPHKGTCFTCVIPLQAALLDDATGIDEAAELKVDTPYLAPLTHHIQSVSNALRKNSKLTNVLVVEDNIIAQLAVKIILSSMACHVDVASNGEEALVSCNKNNYDMILMDIGLGEGMDGYDVTRHIRKIPGDIKDAPIIALTAHGADENKQRCIEAGMNAVLTKPLTKAQAADILKTFIPARKTPSVPIIKASRPDLPDSDMEMFQLDQFSLFDVEQGLKNSGNKTMLIELLTMMVSDLPNDLEEMKTAFQNEDIPQVEHLAHKIKGGAVYVGTTRLKYACQYLERYWKSGEQKLFNDLYYQAIKTIEDSRDCINEWLRNNKKPE